MRSSFAMLTLGALLITGCASTEMNANGADSTESAPEIPSSEFAGEAPPVPTEIFPEAPAERAQRVQLLETLGDRWNEAGLLQRYDTKESIESGMRTLARDKFDALMSDLKNGPLRNQRIAAWAIGFSGNAAAVPPLLALLDHPQADVVLHSLLSLHNLQRPQRGASPSRVLREEDLVGGDTFEPDPVRIDPKLITPLLQHPDARIRSNASLVIMHALDPKDEQPVPDEVFLALVAARQDQDDATRSHVAAALGRTRTPRAVPHLVRAIQDDQIPLVRIRAALGLARLNDLSAVPTLIDALRRPAQTEEVKKYVATSLSILLAEPSLRSIRAEDWVPLAQAKGAY